MSEEVKHTVGLITFVRCKICGGEFDEGEWDADTRCPECESPKQADDKRRAAISQGDTP